MRFPAPHHGLLISAVLFTFSVCTIGFLSLSLSLSVCLSLSLCLSVSLSLSLSLSFALNWLSTYLSHIQYIFLLVLARQYYVLFFLIYFTILLSLSLYFPFDLTLLLLIIFCSSLSLSLSLFLLSLSLTFYISDVRF